MTAMTGNANPPQKTWVNFQTHYTEAHLEMCESAATNLGGGCQGQSNSTETYQQESTDTLA